MDSITQAVLGAAIGEEILGKKIGGKAAVLGAIIATIPDLDVIILPFISPLDRLSMHRGYSHSILFSVIAAFGIAYILSKVKWTKKLDYYSLVICTFLCLFTHIILDAFTSYGTLLLLPFSDSRVGFDSINVVDPVYTMPLILGLICSLNIFSKSVHRLWYNRIGLLLSTSYLLATLAIKSKVEDEFINTLTQNKVEYTELMSQPVGVASLHWYGVARDNEGIYIGDYSFINPNDITFTYFPFNNSLLETLDRHLVDRMQWFAKGYYHIVSEDNIIKFYNLQVDMQGIQKLNDRLAPTKGYFTIKNGESKNYHLGSDRHVE